MGIWGFEPDGSVDHRCSLRRAIRGASVCPGVGRHGSATGAAAGAWTVRSWKFCRDCSVGGRLDLAGGAGSVHTPTRSMIEEEPQPHALHAVREGGVVRVAVLAWLLLVVWTAGSFGGVGLRATRGGSPAEVSQQRSWRCVGDRCNPSAGAVRGAGAELPDLALQECDVEVLDLDCEEPQEEEEDPSLRGLDVLVGQHQPRRAAAIAVLFEHPLAASRCLVAPARAPPRRLAGLST